VPHRTSQNASKRVPSADVVWDNAIAQQEADGAQMIGNHSGSYGLLVATIAPVASVQTRQLF
jgi:hypothetical protein